MNRRTFESILYAVAHDRAMKRHEAEAVLAEASRLRDAIELFSIECALGATDREVASLRLVLEGAPFGTTGRETRRVMNNGKPKGRSALDG